MSTYSHSGPLGARLSTTTAARRERIGRALSRVGRFLATFEVTETDQASASVATFPNGLRVLVSYETAVAFQSMYGHYVATPYGEFSRTTDKSVRNFCPSSVERVTLAEFSESLARELTS